MRIFLDTNVMVDFCAERESFYPDAAAIIEMGYDGKITPIASSLTFVNIAYVLRKVKPRELVIQKLEQLMDLCVVSSIDRQTVSLASSSRSKDFEDAVQYFSALQAKADLIITRDTKGFADFDLLVMTPAEFPCSLCGVIRVALKYLRTFLSSNDCSVGNIGYFCA